MRRVVLAAGLVSLIVASSFVACAPPTEIVVTVTTDVPCTAGIDTGISVGETSSEAELRAPSATSSRCDQKYVGRAVLTPSGERNGELTFRVVMGVTRPAESCAAAGYSGCIVGRRALRYIPGHRSDVSVHLEDACRGVVCTPDTTCAAGLCIPAATDCTSGTCTVTEGAIPTRWKPMAAAPDCGAPFSSAFPSWAWTGDELVIFGGGTARGAAYRPSTDQWRCLAGAPLPTSRGPVTIWMPSAGRVFVWGGQGGSNQPGLWNPASGTWTQGAASPSELSLVATAAVWSTTTREVIVWGGQGAPESNRGGAYDPEKNTWRLLPLDPPTTEGYSSAGLATYKGRVIRFGGVQGGSTKPASYAVYDPAIDTWTTPETASNFALRYYLLSLTLPTGALFWGGRSGGTAAPFGDGVVIDELGKVSTLAPPGPGVARWGAGGWFSHGRVWLFGGSTENTGGPDNALADGWTYELATKQWTAMPTQGAPSKRTSPVVVWTGTVAIVWGGYDGTKDGAGNYAITTDGAILAP